MNETQSRPVFLVGTGRCGSTITYSCLAMHPAFGWIPSWVSAIPRFPRLSVVNRIWSIPGVDRFRETKFFPKPVEPNSLFVHWLPGYYNEVVDESTVEQAQAQLPRLFRNMLSVQGKSRFLVKMVGRPIKIELLARVFPGAFFIHVKRDLKPTVCSLLQVDFYKQPGLDPWPWGVIPPEYLDYYTRCGNAIEVAAAIKVRLNRREVGRQLSRISPDQRMEVPYAEFVKEPVQQLQCIAERVGIRMDDYFFERIRSRKIYGGADHKWKGYFTPRQIENLEGIESMKEPPIVGS